MNKITRFIRLGSLLLGKTAIPETRKPLVHMGWMKGLEPSTTGITIRCVFQSFPALDKHMPNKSIFTVSFIIKRLRPQESRILGTFYPFAIPSKEPTLIGGVL